MQISASIRGKRFVNFAQVNQREILIKRSRGFAGVEGCALARRVERAQPGVAARDIIDQLTCGKESDFKTIVRIESRSIARRACDVILLFQLPGFAWREFINRKILLPLQPLRVAFRKVLLPAPIELAPAGADFLISHRQRKLGLHHFA